MPNLTTTDLHAPHGEPRVPDLKLARALGMIDPHAIRRIIERNNAELATHGSVSDAASETGPKGGRPGRTYLLNEAQALLVCMFARTPLAAAVRREVIEVFTAWRAGKTVPVKAHHRRPPAAEAALQSPYGFELDQPDPRGPVTIRMCVPMRMASAVISAYDATAASAAT